MPIDGSEFVGREDQLSELHGKLDAVLDGHGQCCFLVGTAGAGKSTLMREFAAQAETRCPDLLFVSGMCDAGAGSADPYLPFRDILQDLTGLKEAPTGTTRSEYRRRSELIFKHSTEMLLEIGPDLVGTFIPFAKIVAKVATLGFNRTPAAKKLHALGKKEVAVLSEVGDPSELSQAQLVEQYVNFIERVANQSPLLIFIDDLQWADPASVGLLFRLVRRLEQSRILVIGAYRPDEVASHQAESRHPLAKLVHEMQRHHGNVLIDLDEAARNHGLAFVDAFLNLEPNLYDASFRRIIWERTGGQPLFTSELMHHLRALRAVQVNPDGRWIANATFDWSTLPERIEGVISERIDRLPERLRRLLALASVEGELFTAETIAAVESQDPRDVVALLSGPLQKEHMLIANEGVERVGNRRLSRYRFAHNLIRTFMCTQLDDAQRAYMHEDVGSALEAIYADQAPEIAVQLAEHFREAGLPERAAPWMLVGGQQAASRFANDPALMLFTQALESAPKENLSLCFEILVARERVYAMVADRTHQRADLEAMGALAAHLSIDAQVQHRLRQGWFELDTSAFTDAEATATQAIQLLSRNESTTAQVRLAEAQLLLSQAHLQQGEYQQSLDEGARALQAARSLAERGFEARVLHHLGMVEYRRGTCEVARELFRDSYAIAQETSDARQEAAALNALGIVSPDPEESRRYYEQALEIARTVGDRKSEADMLANIAESFFVEGDYALSMVAGQAALDVTRDTGHRRNEAIVLITLGECHRMSGDAAQALRAGELALGICRQIGFNFGSMVALENLSVAALEAADPQVALDYALECLEAAQRLSHADYVAKAFMRSSEVMLQWGQWDDAEAALAEAQSAAPDGDQILLAVNRAALKLGRGTPTDIESALAEVEQILTNLSALTVSQTNELPVRLYLVCTDVLLAANDPRAQALLDQGRVVLQRRAARISDPQVRRSFLHQVPSHAELMRRTEQTPTQPP